MDGSEMKLIAAMAMSVLLLAAVCACGNEARAASGSSAPAPAHDPQAITITPNQLQPAVRGSADHFSGSVRTDNVLFGDVWARAGLSPRDRSLVTVRAFAMNRPDQLRSHLARARRNGVTREELIGVITHLAFYAGWPSAVTGVMVAKEVFKKE
jgi:4-carboxymuconolactone decarboxylase